MSRYVSPMVRARAIVAGIVPGMTRFRRYQAQRMVQLHPMIIVDLEREEAPFHLFRWVARVSKISEQRRRTDLVLHLRRSIERPRNGWVDEWQCNAALETWDRVRNEARQRGGYPPAVAEVPIDVYRLAIDAKKKRGPSSEVTGSNACEGATAPDLDDQPEEEAEESTDEPEDGPPSSRRPLHGRDHIVRLFTDAVRAAIAAKDLEAADVANDAISRLANLRKA